MPTIHHRACCEMVGTLRFARPADCGLICFMHKRNLVQRRAANWHDRQITSDFQKSCQARKSKIFRFRSHPNQPHNAARLAADEGRSRTSRTCGEMRWTWMAR